MLIFFRGFFRKSKNVETNFVEFLFAIIDYKVSSLKIFERCQVLFYAFCVALLFFGLLS